MSLRRARAAISAWCADQTASSETAAALLYLEQMWILVADVVEIIEENRSHAALGSDPHHLSRSNAAPGPRRHGRRFPRPDCRPSVAPQIGQLVGGTPRSVANDRGSFRGHSSRASRKMARQFLTLERHFGTVSYRIAKGLFALDVTSNASFVRRRGRSAPRPVMAQPLNPCAGSHTRPLPLC